MDRECSSPDSASPRPAPTTSTSPRWPSAPPPEPFSGRLATQVPVQRPDEGLAVRSSQDGSKVFVSGYTYSSDVKSDYVTLAYNARTGARLWVSVYAGPETSTSRSLWGRARTGPQCS